MFQCIGYKSKTSKHSRCSEGSSRFSQSHGQPLRVSAIDMEVGGLSDDKERLRSIEQTTVDTSGEILGESPSVSEEVQTRGAEQN